MGLRGYMDVLSRRETYRIEFFIHIVKIDNIRAQGHPVEVTSVKACQISTLPRRFASVFCIGTIILTSFKRNRNRFSNTLPSLPKSYQRLIDIKQ